MTITDQLALAQLQLTALALNAPSTRSETGPYLPSLAIHIKGEILSRILGKTPSDATQMITDPASWSASEATLTRNANLWCSDIDLTCIAVATGSLEGRGACAISARHIASATHYKPNTVTFIDSGSAHVTRNVVTWTAIANKAGSLYPGQNSDLSIGYLDADLPATITPAAVLPANFSQYIEYSESASLKEEQYIIYTGHGNDTNKIGSNKFIGIVRINNYNKEYLQSCHEILLSTGSLDEKLSPWRILSWHSGSPIGTIINGNFVYMAEMHTNAPSGVLISELFNEVNAVMTTQHGSAAHQLTAIDLSGFFVYGA